MSQLPSLPLLSSSACRFYFSCTDNVSVFLSSCSVLMLVLGGGTLMEALSPVEDSVLSLWVRHPGVAEKLGLQLHNMEAMWTTSLSSQEC